MATRRPEKTVVPLALMSASLAFAVWLTAGLAHEPWPRVIGAGLVALGSGFVVTRHLSRWWAVHIAALLAAFAVLLAIVALQDVVGPIQAMWLFGVSAGMSLGVADWPWSGRRRTVSRAAFPWSAPRDPR